MLNVLIEKFIKNYEHKTKVIKLLKLKVLQDYSKIPYTSNNDLSEKQP